MNRKYVEQVSSRLPTIRILETGLVSQPITLQVPFNYYISTNHCLSEELVNFITRNNKRIKTKEVRDSVS